MSLSRRLINLGFAGLVIRMRTIRRELRRTELAGSTTKRLGTPLVFASGNFTTFSPCATPATQSFLRIAATSGRLNSRCP